MAQDQHGSRASDSMWRWWPCFVGGFCSPLLGHVFVGWISPHLAAGLAFFVMWVVVGLVFLAVPPSGNWSFVKWTGGGALGAVIAGALAFVLHAA